MQSKVSKRNTPRHAGLALLDFPRSGIAPQARSEGASCPIGAFSASCLETCSAIPLLGLLTGMVRLPKPSCSTEGRQSCLCARTDSPVRRVSGIGAEGVKSQGCDESCAEPWTAQRSGPLERRWTTAWMQEVERRRMPKPSERTRFAALRRNGPDAGGAFSLLTFSLRKQTKRSEVTASGWPEGRAKRVKESDAPSRAQPVVESRGTCNQPSRCPRLHEKACRPDHP